MKLKYLKAIIFIFVCSFGLVISGSSSLGGKSNTVMAVDLGKINPYHLVTGCSISAENKVHFSNNFNEELKKRGIPSTIKVAGKTLRINKEHAINDCMILYGSRSDVPGNVKDQRGEWLYIGYDVDGQPFGNYHYLTLGGSADFLKTRHFIKNPWDNPYNIAWPSNPGAPKAGTIRLHTFARNHSTMPIPNNVKPYNQAKMGMTKTELLDTAIDIMYLRYSDNWPKGARGYFVDKNNYLGHDMTGKNLINYAYIMRYPDDYSAGDFNMYQNCGFGFCYSGTSLPPLKVLFEEKNDLAVTSFQATTSGTIFEGDNVTFSYTLKNEGEVTIVDPTVRIKFGGRTANFKVTGNLKPGKSTTKSATLKSPISINQDTTYTVEIIANPDRDNPVGDLNWSTNNKATTNVKVTKVNKKLEIVDIKITNPNSYFDGNADDIPKFFEGEEVKFEYSVKFTSNKPNDTWTNPVVEFGKEILSEGDGGLVKQERLNTTLSNGQTYGPVKASFQYSN